jgi:hypothetical protein
MITPSFSLTATERVLPKLALDFTTASLDPRVTFTRAGNTATYFNSLGVLTNALADQPRFDFNPVSLVCKGLLIEETRTNKIVYSQDVSQANWTKANVTVNTTAGTAPDGTNTANLITANTTGTPTQVYQDHVINATSCTWSIFVKRYSSYDTTSVFRVRNVTTGTNLVNGFITWSTMTVTLGTIEAINNDWYRITFPVTTGITSGNSLRFYLGWQANNGTAGNGLYAWGMQVEEGAFATSYIPTVASQVTRNADVATMTGTNFSDWYNASEGSFNVGFIFNSEPGFTSGGTSQRALYVSDGTTNNRMDIPRIETSSDRMFAIVQTAGSLDVFAQINALNTTNNTQYYVCFGYKVNNFAAAITGLTPLTDTALNIPTVNQLRFGALTATTGLINGYITNMEYYPQKLTNNEIQAFSKG